MSETDVSKSGEGAAPPRRAFLSWLARGFLSLWALGAAWVVGSFVKAPESEGSLGERVLDVGGVDDIPVGQAKPVRHGREPLLVVRRDESTLVALSAVCTHLHCVLQWDEEQQIVRCPCHDGAFDINGNVLAGPPPRPLETFPVETQLGRVYVRL